MYLGGDVDLLVSGFHWHELQLAPENSLPCDPSITSVVLVIESGKLDTHIYIYVCIYKIMYHMYRLKLS